MKFKEEIKNKFAEFEGPSNDVAWDEFMQFKKMQGGFSKTQWIISGATIIGAISAIVILLSISPNKNITAISILPQQQHSQDYSKTHVNLDANSDVTNDEKSDVITNNNIKNTPTEINNNTSLPENNTETSG